MSLGTAYVQARDDGQPYSVHGAVAAGGFEKLGAAVRLFRRSELDQLPLTYDTIVVGGVGTIHAALQRLGVPPPPALVVPAALEPYLGRRLWHTTVEEIRLAGNFPVFVKPYEATKLFDGRILRQASDVDGLLRSRADLPPDVETVPVLAQEVVPFHSEWRVFVVDGVVQGVSHYGGDPLRFPSANIIRTAIGGYVGAPSGYAADFGVLQDGRTVLIEFNDGFSLGHGGLAADRYARLLAARWMQLVSFEPTS